MPTRDSDQDRADLAGTRMLIAEESFDALLGLMIDAGLVPRGCAAAALDRLVERLMLHASGRSGTHYGIRPPELLDQAGRLSRLAAGLRMSTGWGVPS
jgi:hypothetical protein